MRSQADDLKERSASIRRDNSQGLTTNSSASYRKLVDDYYQDSVDNGGKTIRERLSNAADFADKRASIINGKADTMEANNNSDTPPQSRNLMIPAIQGLKVNFFNKVIINKKKK